MVEGPGVWVSSELISTFDFAQVWVSKFDQTFDFQKSEFDFESLILLKLWVLKLQVSSNFEFSKS